ncbi:DnaJ homolog subfamily C member 14-like protein [Tanacetum coccineum]
MAYLNKGQATKAFEIAIGNTLNEKYEEALKSAKEARLMNPELPDIKKLVTLLQVLSAYPDITHYGILGVEETANANEIGLAYRKLAVDLNPDTNIFPKASEAFRRIYEAMRVLSHDRLKYDNDLAVARKARAIVAEMEAENEAMYDLFAPARVGKFDALHGKDFIVDREALPWVVAESEAMFGEYSVIAPECRARFGAFEALHGRDFLADREARARAVPDFKAVFGKDVVVAPERGALFDVVEAFNFFETIDGMISSSELQAAFQAYDEEPQSTTHHPSQKRFVCSSDEVAGRGTKRSNTTQATLTHPVPKKKMDGQSPLFFK